MRLWVARNNNLWVVGNSSSYIWNTHFIIWTKLNEISNLFGIRFQRNPNYVLIELHK